ncbi:ISLre2 family transposase [Butyrivibrio sp. LB2008]|uniref:ISLre2 family transposase n=1 Tax=Butyrivibrio sp. LB2008 TaxID=1408305 RepID=UPI00047E408D|nr:ISLre2 family transposase [Butyrivibrio sp. LB2008]
MDIVTLFEQLASEIFEAEENFFTNPKDFYSLEKAVKSSTDSFAAAFIGSILTGVNEAIYKSGFRNGQYTAQHTRKRTLISAVGDIVFECTNYRKVSDKSYHYLLEEIIGIEKNEHFTEAAEVAILTEALKTSYQEATLAVPSKQRITKTTVMNKVHQIAEEIPVEAPSQKKECRYLFIEADEDHVAEQHGRYPRLETNGSFISKLVYIYEYKMEVPRCKGRKQLVNKFYFGGLYQGRSGVERLWKKVSAYIESAYDTDELRKVYISGDGAGWIKTGANIIDKAIYCADKFHLVKYINSASNKLLDSADEVKSELYHMLYKRDRKGFKGLIDLMKYSTDGNKAVIDLESYVLGNWMAVMRTVHSNIVKGCSAEGHVSHVLSDRLSSRPKAWSQTGADRMSKLRCYERNYGTEKIIDLVRYSREQRKLKRTGTDEIDVKSLPLRSIKAEHYSQARSYIDRLHATIPGLTARKAASIRNQLNLL